MTKNDLTAVRSYEYDLLPLMTKFFLLTVLVMLCLSTGCSRKQANAYPNYGSGMPQYGKGSRGNVVEAARSNLGVKYRRGGNLPETGFDCSGLVLWSYRQSGITMPRTAREQMQVGQAVRKENLRPGDLVAFKISGRRGYHTGIYSGNGKFIHSPSSGKSVEEESINSTYWKKRFITGRRVTKN